MNVELLEKVKAHILAEPRRFFMVSVLSSHSGIDAFDRGIRWPTCGTVGCFAGWAFVLSGHSPKDMSPRVPIAQSALGLNDDEAHRLFYETPTTWSFDDSMKLWSGDGTPETAALAARRIDEFIASDGAL